MGATVFLALVVPAWAYFGSQVFPGNVFASATGCVLVVALLVATYTDLRWRLIPNWITYSAILFGVSLNAIDSYTTFEGNEILGGVRLQESLTGFLVLFWGLLVIFSFSGGGAGDVKLAGAIGALLGITRGTEAVCLSFIVCAILALGWECTRRRAKSDGIDGENAVPDKGKITSLQIPLAPFFALGTFLVLVRDSMIEQPDICLLYTSPSPRDRTRSRMPSSA